MGWRKHLKGGWIFEERHRVALVRLVFVAASMSFAFPAVALSSLPDARVYEQVSPIEKEGYAAVRPGGHDPFTVAIDGEAVAFGSPGTFAGAQSDEGYNAYLARRQADGWVTVPDSIPTTNGHVSSSTEDFAPDLEKSLAFIKMSPNFGRDAEATEAGFALYEPGGDYAELPAGGLKAVTTNPGAEQVINAGGGRLSSDLSHVVFTEVLGTLLPEDTMLEEAQLYAISGVNGSDSHLELIGVDSEDKVLDPYCAVNLGGVGSTFNSIAADGSEIFFTTDVVPSEEKSCSKPATNPEEVFVRLNGEKTIEVSRPPGSPECGLTHMCTGANRNSAMFQGASSDGTRAYFTTSASLVTEDKDMQNDLYMVEIDKEVGKVTVSDPIQVSRDSNVGEAADVQGVVRISDDGSRIYFVARGVLAGANAEGRAAVENADNLYVYNAISHTTVFVADLCSGQDESGSVVDVTNCPSSESDEGLWRREDAREAQATPANGQVLVFSSYGQLTSDDTDSAKDVYRYDTSQGLQRISVGDEGYDSNGNNSMFDAQIARPDFGDGTLVGQDEMRTRAVTENGSEVVFTSAEPLAPGAINGKTNVYEWQNGNVALISSGTSPEADDEPVITPSGHDIFFDTVSGLVPSDTDGLRDVYDARVGGGFPLTSVPPAGCSPASCAPSGNLPPVLAAPGSLGPATGENSPETAVKPKTLTRAQKLTKALRACAKLSKRRRQHCITEAKRTYGGSHTSKKPKSTVRSSSTAGGKKG